MNNALQGLPRRSIGVWTCVAASCALLAACGGGSSSTDAGPVTGTPGGGTVGAGSGYTVTALVSDGSAAAHTDAHLVNAWGLAFNPTGYAWVANASTSTSTLYDGNGVPQPLVVDVPAGSAGAASPTGVVFNGGGGFEVTQGTTSGTSVFLFAGEAGTIAGWSPNVNGTAAITAFDGAAAGAVFKGLAMATDGANRYLYATDFHNAAVRVFDSQFAPVTVSGGFQDPNLPGGYAPFGIQTIDNRLYVTFAKQDAAARDAVPGAGLGVVDVFDTQGVLLQRFAGGTLNAPWGVARAPSNFGPYGNALLVANFGDGKINAFNASTGVYLGTLASSSGPIAIDGLWAIAFGNGVNNQPANTLFFTAGPGAEAHGLYGRIDAR